MTQEFARWHKTGIYDVDDRGTLKEKPVEVAGEWYDIKMFNPTQWFGLLSAAERDSQDILSQCCDKDADSDIVKDARETLENCRAAIFYSDVPQGQREPKWEAVAFFSMKATMAYQRMLFRKAERDAQCGISVRRGGQRGHKIAHADVDARQLKIAQFVERLVADGSKVTPAVAKAETEFGVSQSTVWRARKKFRQNGAK